MDLFCPVHDEDDGTAGMCLHEKVLLVIGLVLFFMFATRWLA